MGALNFCLLLDVKSWHLVFQTFVVIENFAVDTMLRSLKFGPCYYCQWILGYLGSWCWVSRLIFAAPGSSASHALKLPCHQDFGYNWRCRGLPCFGRWARHSESCLCYTGACSSFPCYPMIHQRYCSTEGSKLGSGTVDFVFLFLPLNHGEQYQVFSEEY